MSGTKIHTLTDNEYYRLTREAASGVRAEAKAKALERENARLSSAVDEQARRNQALQTRISSITASMEEAAKKADATERALLGKIQAVSKKGEEQAAAFAKAIKDAREDAATAIAENNRRIEAVIAANNAAIKKKMEEDRAESLARIAAVKADVAALAAKVGSPEDAIKEAGAHVSAAHAIVAEVEKNFRCELLCPGELAEVKEAIATAADMIAAANANPAKASAALIRGGDAFEAAHKFYERILAAENEWRARLAAAIQAVAAAGYEVDSRKEYVVTGLVDPRTGEKVQDEAFDTDSWTNGAYQELKTAVEALTEALQSEERSEKLSLEELQGVIDQAQVIADESECVYKDAVCAIGCSYNRRNLLADITDELCKRCALELVEADSGHEGDDYRAGFQVHLKSGTTGFDVIINLTTTVENGQMGIRADTEIISPGNDAKTAEVFEGTLGAVMAKHRLVDTGEPIPVNPEAKVKAKDWKKRKATVPAKTKVSAKATTITI